MNLDFAAIMVFLVFLSGGIWAYDAIVSAPKRKRALSAVGDGAGELEERQGYEEPKVVEYARSFFPIFLIVLLLRSFLIEPFRIPSGSMMPTLLIGDFILVNKYDYGIRLPVLNKKIFEIGTPERGDIVVFRYPENPSIPYIKRIVGLPGDEVVYSNKTLYVNGKPMLQKPLGRYEENGSGRNNNGAAVRLEDLGRLQHEILLHDRAPSVRYRYQVPAGHYFVLGDNRDNSRDSRFWGTVPDENLIGRAFLIWMSWDLERDGVIGWNRLGDSIE